MKKSRGSRRGTRKKLRKSPRQRGMPPVTKFLQSFDVGETVAIKIDPSVHEGMPDPKFHGRTGKVIGQQGKAYLVQVRDGGMMKTLIVAPVHLKRVEVSR